MCTRSLQHIDAKGDGTVISWKSSVSFLKDWGNVGLQP